MNKSVYSIVLMDDVIKEVDKEAYRLGTNRSNLINQILAEHLSCVTPEMRMRTIYDAVSEFMGSSFIQRQSAAMLTLRTALEYKYRPTISYKLELERVPSEYLGRLKIVIRTQNAELKRFFSTGFGIFAEVEMSIHGRQLWSGCESGCIRSFINPEGMTDDAKGEAVGNYISLLNKAVKLYFADTEPLKAVEAWYMKEYKKFSDKYRI